MNYCKLQPKIISTQSLNHLGLPFSTTEGSDRGTQILDLLGTKF